MLSVDLILSRATILRNNAGLPPVFAELKLKMAVVEIVNIRKSEVR